MKEFTILLEIACIPETRQGCKCLSSKGWKKPPQDTMLQKITGNAKVSFLIISGVRTRTVYINYQQFRTVKFRSLNSDKTFNISDDIGQRFWIKYLRLFSYFLPVFSNFTSLWWQILKKMCLVCVNFCLILIKDYFLISF